MNWLNTSAENVRYMERLRYSPILHTDQGLKLTEISQAVIDGLKQGERDFGIKTGVIIAGLGIWIYYLTETCRVAVAQNKGVIGFDLAGGEYKHPAKDHKEAFDLAFA